jgi:hypothetical protein
MRVNKISIIEGAARKYLMKNNARPTGRKVIKDLASIVKK